MLIVLAGWLALSSASIAMGDVQTLHLLGRSSVEGYRANLPESEWRWLRDKAQLHLGVSAPDYTPFEITTDNQELEGITADYADLLGKLLHVDIQVRRYDSRRQVLQALKEGEVDLVGTANGFDEDDHALVMSESYTVDQPILVEPSLSREPLPPSLAGKRIAMLYHYLPPDQVRAFYPKATLQLYPSILSALGAVAFGQADVYLGDFTSAHYLISKNYLNNVKVAEFSRLDVSNFGFALMREDRRLQRIINTALAAIPPSENAAIQRRWSGGGSHAAGLQTLQFSKAEQRWLDSHPRLKVVVNEAFLPLSFYNQEGEFSGISAQVLDRITLRTGLKFDIRKANSQVDLIRQVQSGEVDMVAAIIAGPEQEGGLRYTRAYLNSPFVFVTRMAGSPPKTLDEMAGKTLAVMRGNVLNDYLTQRYGQVSLVPTQNSMESLEKVAQGDVDGSVVPLIMARYLIPRQYSDRLHIATTVGTEQARIAFGVSRSALELHSILNKALLSIPPEEMDELTSHWPSETMIDYSYWINHRLAIIQGFSLAAVALLFTLGWVAYLRRLIRKREQAERALNDQLMFMRVLIDGTPHPTYVRDRQGRLMTCNSSYLEVFGCSRESVIGKAVIENLAFDEAEARGYHSDYLRVMEEGMPHIRDRALTLPDGRMLTIYHWILPYRDGGGEVVGMIAGWVDVSDRQQLLGQLQAAKEQADAANRAKTTFLATMSHEIRTPMNAVIGMLELALNSAEKGVADQPAIKVAFDAARGMLELIGDILDIARIESGHMSLSPERANVRELLESLVRIFEGLARDKGLSLALDIGDGIDAQVLIDPLRFKQIISNVLSNAIKFTERGQVRIQTRGVPTGDPDRLRIELCISDTGVGISAEDQKRLFNPFEQARNQEQSARNGAGLGLVISLTLCEMMGGKLRLSSVLGQGTQVDMVFELPRLSALAPQELALISAPDVALDVLVADDYLANRQLLFRQLTHLGHRVTKTEDGVQAMKAWLEQPFDVVITDCNMPSMNGYELAKSIRNQELAQEREPCLILGFTANALPEERERCLQAGMDDCLFKPCVLDDLRARLALWIESVPQRPQPDLSQGLDLTGLKKITGDDIEGIKLLLGDLHTSLKEDYAQLLEQSKTDLGGLADLAHRIKGGARFVNAGALIKCCDGLEQVCREGNAGAVDAMVETLQASIEQVLGHITQAMEQPLK